MVTKLSRGKRKAFYINGLKYINLSEMVVNLNYIAALLLLYIWIHFNFGFKFWFFWFQLRDATKKHNQPKRRINSVRLFFEKRNPSSSWPIPPDWKRQVNNFIFFPRTLTPFLAILISLDSSGASRSSDKGSTISTFWNSHETSSFPHQ